MKNTITLIAVLLVLTLVVSAQGPWWESCPGDPPTPTAWPIQPTYTPLAVPTCRPTATLAPNPSPTPYLTYTPYPPQPLMDTRWLWVNSSTMRTESGVANLLESCQQAGITDLAVLLHHGEGWLLNSNLFTMSPVQVGGQVFFDYLIERANLVGIRVHAWWTIGYWRGSWAYRIAGCPDEWNIALETNDQFQWVDLRRADVLQAGEDAVRDICQNNPGLAGIHLDYIRWPTTLAKAYPAFTEEHLTTFVSRARDATNEFGMGLSVAGVPIWSEGWPGYNFDIYGCSQDWPGWIEADLIDRVLAMNYYNPATLEDRLTNHYDLLLAAIGQRVVNGVAVRDYYGTDQLFTVEEWQQLLTVNQSHGYDLCVFNNLLLDQDVRYWEALGQ